MGKKGREKEKKLEREGKEKEQKEKKEGGGGRLEPTSPNTQCGKKQR